jgi:Tfp pilus assembly protein PilP
VAITPAEILIEELVPDGMGSFYKRSAAIALEN